MSIASAPIEGIVQEVPWSEAEAIFEIVDGHRVEKPPMGAESDEIAMRIGSLIGIHPSGRLGHTFGGGCGYQKIFPDDPTRVRYPDFSFIRSGRFPGEKTPRGYVQIFPDLAAEIVSPNDNAEDIERRLTDFLRAGTPLVWMIYPFTRHVYVFHQGSAALRLGPADTLDGEDVIPGFSCRVGEIFSKI